MWNDQRVKTMWLLVLCIKHELPSDWHRELTGGFGDNKEKNPYRKFPVNLKTGFMYADDSVDKRGGIWALEH